MFFRIFFFFFQFPRRAFDVPDTVRWDVLLDELHWFWIKNCRDSGSAQKEPRGLDEDARRYLTVKLLGKIEFFIRFLALKMQ